jgi:hypothetical protein
MTTAQVYPIIQNDNGAGFPIIETKKQENKTRYGILCDETHRGDAIDGSQKHIGD